MAITPSEQAHALGLEYCGFSGWCEPETRDVVAYTVDGKLVRRDEVDSEKTESTLGRVIILDLDDNIIRQNPEKPAVKNYVRLIRAILQTGNDFFVLHARNSEELAAKFLEKIGITSGVTLVPYGSSSPDKKKKFVEQKIKQGYTEIQFFDRDPISINAVESLAAPYNKLDVDIETHRIPTFDERDHA